MAYNGYGPFPGYGYPAVNTIYQTSYQQVNQPRYNTYLDYVPVPKYQPQTETYAVPYGVQSVASVHEYVDYHPQQIVDENVDVYHINNQYVRYQCPYTGFESVHQIGSSVVGTEEFNVNRSVAVAPQPASRNYNGSYQIGSSIAPVNPYGYGAYPYY